MKQLIRETTSRYLPLPALLSLLVSLAACVLVAAQTPTPAQQQQRPRLARSAQRTPDTDGGPSPAGEEVDENDVVRVDTQLITVPVVVRNREGRPVTGLTASAFQLYEDDHPQRVATFTTSDAPFEAALLLDTSGSTRAEIELIRRAAYAFIESLRPGDRVAILSFDTDKKGLEKVATIAVQTDLTDNRETLLRAIQNIGASNGTPYYDALERIVQDIFRNPPQPELRGRRALVALTDGVDSTSVSDFAPARAHLLEAGVLAYFVQVDTQDYVEDRLLADCQDDRTLRLSHAQLERYRRTFDPRADSADYADFCMLGSFERMAISRSLYQLSRREMDRLARDTGGKSFHATDLNAARTAFAEVAAEIGRQYSLGYYSTNKTRDDRFRQIRVNINGLAGAQVSAREGYRTTEME
ncbi:MAG: VWA domain-containing protein [Pyrinomonadaceae bacterium]